MSASEGEQGIGRGPDQSGDEWESYRQFLKTEHPELDDEQVNLAVRAARFGTWLEEMRDKLDRALKGEEPTPSRGEDTKP